MEEQPNIGDDYTDYYGGTTDIISSENEAEEMDINDIYPYKSSKYKTLIEVILEPTQRDTFNANNDTKSDIHDGKPHKKKV